MPDIKQYGIKGVGSDLQFGKQSGRLVYDTDHFNVRNKDNSTYQTIRALNPTHDADLATKLYVDSVAKGLIVKEAVKAATNTLTSTDAGSAPNDMSNIFYDSNNDVWTHTIANISLDQVLLGNGDRVLIKDGSTSTQKQGNGIFVYDKPNKKFTRAPDADNAGVSGTELKVGTFVYVTQGNVWAASSWVISSPTGNITLGSSQIVWSQFGGSNGIAVTDGLTKSGDFLSVKTDGVTIGIISGNVSVKSSGNAQQVLVSDGTGSNSASWGALQLDNANATNGILPTNRGGLGIDFSSYTSQSLIVAGTGELKKGNAYEVLQVGAGGNLEYGTLNLGEGVSGTLQVSRGGTGGSNQLTARTGLGLGSGDSPTFEGLTITQGSVSFNGLTYTMPSVPGTSGQLLENNGSGILSWADPPVDQGLLNVPVMSDSGGSYKTKWTVLHCNTTNATQTTMFLNGTSNEISIPNDTTMAFEAKIVARFAGADESFVFILKGMAVNNAGTVTIYNQGTEIISEQDSDWDASVGAGGINLRFSVTGEANKNIKWLALVNTVEVQN